MKTNELQQLAAVLGTDSLLADTAAAGTGRVSIAKLAEFLANGDNAVKAALFNKAPGGYGLGTDCKVVEGFETITENGWYAVLHHDAPDLGGWWIGIYTRYLSLGNILAFRNGHIVHKKRYYDEWGPWEWVNPPMSVGVEYRTVERYRGKPVYCRSINCGAFSGSKKYVDSGIDYAKCAIIRCDGIIDSGSGMFPIAFFPNTATTPPAGICFTISRNEGKYEIRIADTGNAEGEITVTFYYTKIDD